MHCSGVVMPKKLALRIDSSLSAALQQCLPTLQAVSLSLETYGTEVDATRMHDVIERLRSLFPSGTSKTAYPMEFMVNGTFKVSRQQVATALGHAFTGEVTWFRITEMVP